MSRHVRGAPPNPIMQTSMAISGIFGWGDPTPSLHKLVDVTCDDCGTTGVAFDKRLPAGWTARERWAFWPQYFDLCPPCSSKPEPEPDGTAYA